MIRLARATPTAPPTCRAVLLAPDAIPGVAGALWRAAVTTAGVSRPSPTPHSSRPAVSTASDPVTEAAITTNPNAPTPRPVAQTRQAPRRATTRPAAWPRRGRGAIAATNISPAVNGV